MGWFEYTSYDQRVIVGPRALAEAHHIRMEAGAYNVADDHLAQAIAELSQRKPSITLVPSPVPEQAG
jgi:hypothetical protein